jgi:hypothetical protein
VALPNSRLSPVRAGPRRPAPTRSRTRATRCSVATTPYDHRPNDGQMGELTATGTTGMNAAHSAAGRAGRDTPADRCVLISSASRR